MGAVEVMLPICSVASSSADVCNREIDRSKCAERLCFNNHFLASSKK